MRTFGTSKPAESLSALAMIIGLVWCFIVIIHHTNPMIMASADRLSAGYDHRIGVVFYRDYTGLRFGVRSGFMCDSPLDPQFVHYLEGREPNWWPGCVVLTFQNGKLLMPELCIRHADGQAQWRGEVINV